MLVITKLSKHLEWIKRNIGYPVNNHEIKFYVFLLELIAQNKAGGEFKNGKEWSDWVDQEMQVSFENDILEETGEDTLQGVFSDAYYSGVQDARDAMLALA